MGVESEHIFFTTEKSIQRVEARQRASVNPGETSGHATSDKFGPLGPTRTERVKLAQDSAYRKSIRTAYPGEGETLASKYGSNGFVRENIESLERRAIADGTYSRKGYGYRPPGEPQDVVISDPRSDYIPSEYQSYPVAQSEAYSANRSYKSSLASYDKSSSVEFTINPSELKETYSNRYTRLDSFSFPFQQMQYIGGVNPKLSFKATLDSCVPSPKRLELHWFDDSNNAQKAENEKNAIEERIKTLTSWLYPTGSGESVLSAPELLVFTYGATSQSHAFFKTYKVRLTGLTVNRTMFRPDLGTRIAEVDIDLEVVQDRSDRVYAKDIRR